MALFWKYSGHSLSRQRVSRHSGYVDVFVKSRILSLYIVYTILRIRQHVFWFSHLNLIAAQCKLWKLCSLWQNLAPVNLSYGGVNGSLDIQGLRNWEACVIKGWATCVCRMFNTLYVHMYLTSDNHWHSFIWRKKCQGTWKTW